MVFFGRFRLISLFLVFLSTQSVKIGSKTWRWTEQIFWCSLNRRTEPLRGRAASFLNFFRGLLLEERPFGVFTGGFCVGVIPGRGPRLLPGLLNFIVRLPGELRRKPLHLAKKQTSWWNLKKKKKKSNTSAALFFSWSTRRRPPPAVCSDGLSCSTEMHTFLRLVLAYSKFPQWLGCTGIKSCKLIETCCSSAHFYPAKDYPEETAYRCDILPRHPAAGFLGTTEPEGFCGGGGRNWEIIYRCLLGKTAATLAYLPALEHLAD